MEEKAPEVKVSIELTVTEVNNILAALSKFPFEQVSGLIQNVRDQAIAQIPTAPPAEPE
jgi:hypothetical protein